MISKTHLHGLSTEVSAGSFRRRGGDEVKEQDGDVCVFSVMHDFSVGRGVRAQSRWGMESMMQVWMFMQPEQRVLLLAGDKDQRCGGMMVTECGTE